MTETVTCCIPVHNGASTIERAVKSAFDAGCDYVLAYNDGSTDDTWRVMCDLQASQWSNKEKAPHEMGVVYPSDGWAHIGVLRILPVNWPHISFKIRNGVNVARNFLIGEAPHGLIICLDADDELRDITPLLDAWQEGTWVYGDHMEIDKYTQLSRVHRVGNPKGCLPRKELTGITFMFHKQDWLKCGGFDPDFAYAEDYAFQCNLTHHGVMPKYVDTVVYNRYLKAEGNERSALAGAYWQHYHTMARRKYPSVFASQG